MATNARLEMELPHLELVDGTADDIISAHSDDSSKLTWRLGSDAYVYRHRFFLLAMSALVFFLDSALYTGLAPVAPEFLLNDRTNVDVLYGLLFALGPLVSFVVMPIGFSSSVCRGPLETLFPAFGILAVSSLLTATAPSVSATTTRFAIVAVARGISGIGMGLGRSAVPAVTSAAHDSDSQRSEALSSALLGLGIGETLGPAFTGGLATIKLNYGWSLAFFILAVLALGGCSLVLLSQRRLSAEGVHLRVPREYHASVCHLLKDKFIIVICVASLLAEASMSLIPSVIIPWVRDAFDRPPPWQLGLLMMAPNLSYLATTPLLIIFRIMQAGARPVLAALSLLLISASYVSFPFIVHVSVLLVLLPLAGLGVGAAVLDLCTLPVLSSRLVAQYTIKQNAVYKVQNFTLALAFTLGPLVGTVLANRIGYEWAFWSFSILLFVYAPLLCLLRPCENRTQEKGLAFAS